MMWHQDDVSVSKQEDKEIAKKYNIMKWWHLWRLRWKWNWDVMYAMMLL